MVLDHVTGLVYPPGDIDRLSGAIESLATNPQLAREMGERARLRMASWSYAQCVDGIHAALRSLT